MIEIFSPYLTFISFMVTIIFNIWLINKKVDWYILIAGNIILSLIMAFIGIGEYDLLTNIVNYISDLIANILNAIIETIGNIFESIIDAIF